MQASTVKRVTPASLLLESVLPILATLSNVLVEPNVVRDNVSQYNVLSRHRKSLLNQQKKQQQTQEKLNITTSNWTCLRFRQKVVAVQRQPLPGLSGRCFSSCWSGGESACYTVESFCCALSSGFLVTSHFTYPRYRR